MVAAAFRERPDRTCGDATAAVLEGSTGSAQTAILAFQGGATKNARPTLDVDHSHGPTR